MDEVKFILRVDRKKPKMQFNLREVLVRLTFYFSLSPVCHPDVVSLMIKEPSIKGKNSEGERDYLKACGVELTNARVYICNLKNKSV